MSALDEDLTPYSPRRLPRRGDDVVAARHNAPGCVSGVVQAYASMRLSVKTSGEQGLVHLPFGRFSWREKARVWMCWPQDVVKLMKDLDRLDDIPPRIVPLAAVGDYVHYDGRAAWVVKLLSKSVPMAPGVMINKADGYKLCTRHGPVDVTEDQMRFDDAARTWVVRASA